MRKVWGIALAAVLASATPMLHASTPNVSDEPIVATMQTMQPLPNTSAYAMWAHWIRRRIALDAANYHDYRDGRFVPRSISDDVDLITIKTVVRTPDIGNPSASFAHAELGAMPAALPVAGAPGEHITVVSQTPATYLSWTYVWSKEANHGRGGWQLAGTAFRDCQWLHNGLAGARCERIIPAG